MHTLSIKISRIFTNVRKALKGFEKDSPEPRPIGMTTRELPTDQVKGNTNTKVETSEEKHQTRVSQGSLKLNCSGKNGSQLQHELALHRLPADIDQAELQLYLYGIVSEMIHVQYLHSLVDGTTAVVHCLTERGSEIIERHFEGATYWESDDNVIMVERLKKSS